MKTILVILLTEMLLVYLNSCSQKNDIQDTDKIETINIYNTAIHINYYQDDSLNKIRSYQIPILYFNFEAVNKKEDTLNLVLNSHRKTEPKKLYVSFCYESKLDTLVLSDFANYQIIRLKPKDTSRFIIQGFMPDLTHNKLYKDVNKLKLMHHIAQTGKINYTPIPSDTSRIKQGKLLLDSLFIGRSDLFEITYRDSSDTAIE